jgi:hypothetical protein
MSISRRVVRALLLLFAFWPYFARFLIGVLLAEAPPLAPPESRGIEAQPRARGRGGGRRWAKAGGGDG